MEKVYVVVVDHRHGTDVWASRTESGARKHLAEYAREWWDEARGYDDTLPEIPPADDNAVIDQYFTAMAGSESYSEHVTPLT